MPNDDRPLCPLFKALAFCSGHTDNYRWKSGDDFALRVAIQRRAQGPNPARVVLSPLLQLKAAPWQKHKWRGSPEQSGTSPPASQQHSPLLPCAPTLGKEQCRFPLTSQAAAIGRIYFSAIYFESPAPRDVNVGRFFNIDYVRGSGAWDAKEVGDISAIEASLKQRTHKFHHISLLQESDAAVPHFSAPPAITPERISFSFKVSFQGFRFSGGLDVSGKLNRYYQQYGCILTHLYT